MALVLPYKPRNRHLEAVEEIARLADVNNENDQYHTPISAMDAWVELAESMVKGIGKNGDKLVKATRGRKSRPSSTAVNGSGSRQVVQRRVRSSPDLLRDRDNTVAAGWPAGGND